MPMASAISSFDGAAAAGAGEVLLDGLERPAERPHRAGGPVDGADGVEDGAADAAGGEAIEGHAAGVVVALGRLDEAEGAGPGQLLAVDVAGEVPRDLQHHVAHEREVGLDQGRGVAGFGHPEGSLPIRTRPAVGTRTSYDESTRGRQVPTASLPLPFGPCHDGPLGPGSTPTRND